MLFDWLVTKRVMAQNPAHAVYGSKYLAKRCRTPALASDVARAARLHPRQHAQGSARPRAHRRHDLHLRKRHHRNEHRGPYTQGRRVWTGLHENGGKRYDVPCHYTSEQHLLEYVAATDIAWEHDSPLFRNTGRNTGAAELSMNRFTSLLECLAEHGLINGERIGIDASTMEVNSALRSVVRRDSGEGYGELLSRMAQETGIETSTIAARTWRTSQSMRWISTPAR